MDELVKRLRAAAKEWRAKNQIVGVGETRYDAALEEAADSIEKLCGLCASQSKDCSETVGKYLELWAKQPRWISVTERLPKYGTTVLVYGSQGGIYTARYERAKAEWARDSWWKLNSKSHICNPTHWMPLPEPPKGE